MNISTAQDPSSFPPQPRKQSAVSETSSSTNMESEHPDAVGTPINVGTLDSGVEMAAEREKKVGERTVESKISTEMIGNGAMAAHAKESSFTLKPTVKRTLAFPEKVISRIIGHTLESCLRDPVFAPFSEPYPTFWRVQFAQNPVLQNQLDYRWSMLLFASWLRDIQMVNETWAAAVENHPFWATFLSQRPWCLKENEMGSSRSQEPTWYDRVQPGRKEAKFHSSLQSEAEKTCWVCVFQYGPSVAPAPPICQAHMETTALKTIPVCKRHYEADMCHCCLQVETEPNALGLTRQQDFESFGIDDWTVAFVCRRCRYNAVEKAYNQFPIRFTLPRIPSPVQHLYLEYGRGKAVDVIEQLYAIAWAVEYVELEYEYEEETKRWKNSIKNDCLKRGLRCPPLADAQLPLEKANSIFTSSLQWGIDRMIDEGMWNSPQTLSDRLERAQRTGSAVAMAQALPAIHVYNPPLKTPTLRQRTVELTTDWPIKDRAPPAIALKLMQNAYVDLLPDRVERTMRNLKTMITRISNGNLDVAEAKATSMGIDELLAWLNDPRNHISNWWHGQPFIKAITDADIARVFSSKSPESESGAKRKREDSDSSSDEKVDKVAKMAGKKSTSTSTAGSQMDTTPTEAVPSEAVSKEQQTTSTPSGNDLRITLALLTPEKVNRLPWPTPQETLTPRECEYLRMTDFNEKELDWEAVYSVPAQSSELDEITIEILMQVWEDVTKSFSICRCAICRRAREYEKQVVAAESNPQYSEYISLLTSDTKAEDMTDYQRSWLANQAVLLKSAILPEEGFEDELALSDEEHEININGISEPTPEYRDLDSDEAYELYGTDDEQMEEAQEVLTEDDVSYDIPGARLQQNRK